MSTASMATSGGNWHRVGRVREIIAILLEIEEHIHFINAHALHAHPLEVAVNLRQIHLEATGMGQDTYKIKRYLWELQALMEEDVYRSYQTGPGNEDKVSNGNGKQKTQLKTHRRTRVRPRPKYRGNKAKLSRPGK
jgi:hypothetical protein